MIVFFFKALMSINEQVFLVILNQLSSLPANFTFIAIWLWIMKIAESLISLTWEILNLVLTCIIICMRTMLITLFLYIVWRNYAAMLIKFIINIRNSTTFRAIIWYKASYICHRFLFNLYFLNFIPSFYTLCLVISLWGIVIILSFSLQMHLLSCMF